MIELDMRGPAPVTEVVEVTRALTDVFPTALATTHQIPAGVITRLLIPGPNDTQEQQS